MSGAGDVNGDGLADIVVLGNNGAYVVFGKAGTDSVLLSDVASGSGGFFLENEPGDDTRVGAVSGAGDVNGDGLKDVVAGASGASPNGWMSGRTYLVFGKADTDSMSLADVAQGVEGFVIDGQAESDESGVFVSGGGDVNGDGLADVVVGALWADPDGLGESGATYVVFGKADTDSVQLADVANGTGGFAVDGEAESEWVSVSGGDDINGDGLADVIVGAPGAAPNGWSSGRAYVVFGKADTELVSLVDVGRGNGGFAMDGEAERDHAGSSVSGERDVNGDGVPDVLVGAPWADPPGVSDAGRTYVVFGGDFSCEGGG